MINLIEKLQQKPESVRRRFALLFSIGFTVVILLFWAVTFFRGGSVVSEDKRDVETATPLSSLKSSLGASVNQIGDLVGEFKKGSIKDKNLQNSLQ